MITDPYRTLAVVPSSAAPVLTLRPWSNQCFNCANCDRSYFQTRRFRPERRGFWILWGPRPAHNVRTCKSCGARWLEELGTFGPRGSDG